MSTKLFPSLSLLVLAGLMVAAGPAAWAQCSAQGSTSDTGSSLVASGGPVGCVVTNLYGVGGLRLPNVTAAADFGKGSLANLTPLSSAIGTQLSLLPLASPASGFTFTFDPAAGVYNRSSQSFGPILAERAETIGRRKIFLAFSFQRYTFDKIDSLDVRNFSTVLPSVLLPGDPEFEKDVIATSTSVDLKINQSTIFATYGLTNRLDVSVAVPIVDTSITATSNARIIRVANSLFHYFDSANIGGSLQKSFKNSSSASGIGDVTIRVKGTIWKNDTTAIALAADVRLPTGDEKNYLGSGAAGFKPFVIASTRIGRTSPHVNIGYQKSGDSVLAGDISKNVKASLPDQFFWTAGADAGVLPFLTLAFDVVGQRVIDAPRLLPSTFVTQTSPINGGLATAQNLSNVNVVTQSYNIVNGSAGLKVSLGKNFMATANVLIKLNDGGLRDKLSPLFGVSYTF